jgi:hypothetical protein
MLYEWPSTSQSDCVDGSKTGNGRCVSISGVPDLTTQLITELVYSLKGVARAPSGLQWSLADARGLRRKLHSCVCAPFRATTKAPIRSHRCVKI